MALCIQQPAIRARRGHTLVELMVAVISGAMLLAALASTMYIGRQVAYAPTQAQKVLEGTKQAGDLTEELKHAIYIVDHGPTFIEFVTSDRTGDGVEDTFRYEWSGLAGDPLTKTFNRGAPVNVANSVHEFQLDYNLQSSTEELEVLADGAEVQLASQYGENKKFSITSGSHLAYPISLSGLPASAKSWKLTKIQYQATKGGTIVDGFFAIQVRLAGSDGRPTSRVLAEYTVEETNLSTSMQWYALTLNPPVANLSPHRKYCIVIKWLAGDKAADIGLTPSVSGALETSDGGATWFVNTTHQAQVIVHGKPGTVGAPISVNRDRLQGVDVLLRSGESGFSRIDSSVALDNAPLLVTKAWRADFENNPTTQDRNGDGSGDFEWSGGTFSMATIVDGIWKTSGYLKAANSPTITTPVVIDLRGESKGTAGYGLSTWALIRTSPGVYALVSITLSLQADGTQTAKLLGYNGSAVVELASVRGLPAKLLHLRGVFDPVRKLAALQIEGVDYPVVTVPTANSSLSSDVFYIDEDDSDAEYDYAGFQITNPSS